LVLLFVSFQIFATDSKIDSLKKILTQHPQKKKQAEINYLVATAYNKNGDFENSKPYGLMAYKLSTELKDYALLASSCNALCNTFCLLGNYPEGMKYVLEELKIAEEHGFENDKIAALLAIAYINGHNEKNEAAIEKVFEALPIAKKINDRKKILDCYVALSNDFSFVGDADKSLLYADSALQIAIPLHEINSVIEAYTSIATTYTFQQKYDSAIKYDLKTLKIIEQFKTTEKEQMANTCSNIGESYFHLHQFEKASSFYEKALKILKPQNNLEGLRDLYFNISQLDSAKGKWKQAYENFKLRTKLHEQIFNNETAASLENQKRNYEIEKEELLKKEAEEKAEAAHERKELIQISIVILFVLMLTTLLLVLRKRKINPRVVEVIGTFSVLIVFELFTLLTHPLIEKITHHNLLLTLLCLIILASIIVPLHHKVEHWVKHKMGIE
jgi:tetratricopeptide (TPR) repeat protein